jgi:predicted ABC-type ATPase
MDSELKQKRGYLFHLIFLWLPSPEMAVARVKERIMTGGHSVPEDVVRRRCIGGIRNFFEIYRPLADRWFFYDNAMASGPRLIAEGIHGSDEMVHDSGLWKHLSGG